MGSEDVVAPHTPERAESAGWLSPAEQAAWRQLLRVQCVLRERLDRELQAALALSLGDYDVLVHLSEAAPSGLRMSELAHRVLLSRSGLTRRVDVIVRAGLVVREPCDEDGRGWWARLTAAGMELIERAAPVHVAGVRRYLLEPLGTFDGLALGLQQIERALDSGGYGASPVTNFRPPSIQPLVPPATDKAL